MTLREQIPEDFLATVLNTDDFAESILYLPHNRRSREVNALVIRHPPESLQPGDMRIAPRTVVVVANSATEGIPAATITPGLDRIRIASKEGGKVEERAIVEVLSHDFSKVEFEVR